MPATPTPTFAGVLQSAAGTGTLEGQSVPAGPTLTFELKAGECHGVAEFDGLPVAGASITIMGTANFSAVSPVWFPIAQRAYSGGAADGAATGVVLAQPVAPATGVALFLPNLAHCNGIQLTLNSGGPVNVRVKTGSFFGSLPSASGSGGLSDFQIGIWRIVVAYLDHASRPVQESPNFEILDPLIKQYSPATLSALPTPQP